MTSNNGGEFQESDVYQKAFSLGFEMGQKKGVKLFNLEVLKSFRYAFSLTPRLGAKGAINTINKSSQEIKCCTGVLKKCGYLIAWSGTCESTVIADNGQCKDHQDTCEICKKNLSTKSCDHASQFVCGVPICDNCTHQH